MVEDSRARGTLAAAARARGVDVSEQDLRDALDRIVADAIPFVAGVLGILLGFFAIADPFIYPPGRALYVALVDAAAALGFLGVYVLTRREGIQPRHANPTAFLLSMLVMGDVTHDLLMTGDPTQTLYFVLLVAGAGSILLSTTWLLLILGSTMASFLLVAWMLPGDWTTFGFALFAAVVLSFVIHQVRVRTYRRLEILRLVAEKAGVERDLREQALEAAVQSAWESEERYRRLVEQHPDAFLVHSEGRIAYANKAAAALLGAATADELLGRDIMSLVHPAYRDVARKRIHQIEKEGRPTDLLEMKVMRVDGGEVDVEAMGQPIQFLGKPADQTIIRDITDRRRADIERRLSEGRLAEISRLKEMDRMKTQFVNTLSHELRTPLTPIKVQLHLLKNAAGDPERHRKATDMLERNFQRLSSLVDELLEVARLQAGNLKLDKGPLELDHAIHETLENFTDVAKQQGVDVVPKLAPAIVEGDPKRLSQVMYNLLNNALKFTPRGGRILVEAGPEAGRAVVRVTDSGIGLRPEDIQRLFEPFSQVHDTMQKTNAGTGLGLYICKGIIEGHGGRIWCESPGPGKGATFAFELPLVPPGAGGASPP
ncbi:MAG TPA: PAS domain-containing sensor histidine kinase [Candidatus Thermoplasmatota archaeon]|nr:PAS domain-containing sensor histidine kinase [Candidatus Thermoplasmatota archaeon]